MRKLNENEQEKLDEMIYLDIKEERLNQLIDDSEDIDSCPQCSRELDEGCCHSCGEVYLDMPFTDSDIEQLEKVSLWK